MHNTFFGDAFMKRITLLFIALFIIFTEGRFAYAYDASHDGIDFFKYCECYYPRVKQGQFIYYMSSNLKRLPLTYEAKVYLEGGNDRAGVLFSNKDDSDSSFISIETQKDGYVLYRYSQKNGQIRSAVFDAVCIPPRQWTHVAISHNPRKKSVSLYFDGELIQSLNGYPAPSQTVLQKVFTVGGDSEYQSFPPFHGRISELCLFYTLQPKSNVNKHYKNGITDYAGVIAHFRFTASDEQKNVRDLSPNGYLLIYSKTWLTKAEADAKRDGFESGGALALIGDTQYMAEFYPSALTNVYKWIEQNKSTLDIRCVLGLGDMTNRDTEYEWQNVKRAISELKSTEHIAIRGNHDIRQNTADSNNAYHLSQSGVNTMLGKSTGGNGFCELFKDVKNGYPEKKSVNFFKSVEIGNKRWLIICLDYKPDKDALEWAEGVLKANPDTPTIVTTHAYLNRDGNRLEEFDYIWTELISRYDTIKLVISGHINSARVITKKQGGVTQMLVDMQSCDNRFRGAGFVTLLHFNKDATDCYVECISTASESQGLYYRTVNQFKFSI